MERIVDIALAEIVPSEDAVLRAMGVPTGRDAAGRKRYRRENGSQVDNLLAEALSELKERAEPRGIVTDVGAHEFARIYEGEGRNEHPSPLEEIFPRAEALVLFAVTLGEGLSGRASALFAEGRLALGATLDAAASEATELAGVFLDGLLERQLRAEKRVGTSSRALRYSPGYCGWDITGQRALFDALRPGDIGLQLNRSCLMRPLKSISGVVVIGPPEVHEFTDDYAFCSECRTRDCRRRIARLRASAT